MAEATVSTNDIRTAVAHSTYHALEEGMFVPGEPYTAFDRWLAEHDREVARRALLDEATALEGYTLNHYSGATMLDHVLRLIRRDAGEEQLARRRAERIIESRGWATHDAACLSSGEGEGDD